MKNAILALVTLSAIACTPAALPSADNARDALTIAAELCKARALAPKPVREACAKFDAARNASREAAKAVLDVVPEVK